MTLVLDARGPERLTTFAPTRTATDVAVMARPFTMVSPARPGASRVADGRRAKVEADEATGAAAVAGGVSDLAGTASTGLALP